MFKEFPELKQHQGERTRKCFYDDYFDLFIWYETDGSIHGFQLCYSLGNDEHSLDWDEDEKFQHNRIDDGDKTEPTKKTPIILADGTFPYKKVIDEFLDRVDKNDKTNLQDLLFVYDKLIEYTNTGGKLG